MGKLWEAGKGASGCLVFSAGLADLQLEEFWTSPLASWTCIQHWNIWPRTHNQTGEVWCSPLFPASCLLAIDRVAFASLECRTCKGCKASVVCWSSSASATRTLLLNSLPKVRSGLIYDVLLLFVLSMYPGFLGLLYINVLNHFLGAQGCQQSVCSDQET